ncbi:hypothetical protein V495_01097 [Pseudogymnoascus sp. VKM F-4514 (FW-929)]|nr:hypothetical protein V495_01097 [Pseudogymnoascus sp. VKM F-4514 (FW-929)]KFY63969.1 hypothetical protein V497_01870 [Pseudogymnoascus sp. VKM F-4516 (FW-969)]
MTPKIKRSLNSQYETLITHNGARTTTWPLPQEGRSVLEVQVIRNAAEWKDVPAEKNRLIPPYHWHWYQTEYFDIKKGFIFTVEGQEKRYDATAPTVIIPATARHTWCADSSYNGECEIHSAYSIPYPKYFLRFASYITVAARANSPAQVSASPVNGLDEKFFRNIYSYLEDCDEQKVEPSLPQLLLIFDAAEFSLAFPGPALLMRWLSWGLGVLNELCPEARMYCVFQSVAPRQRRKRTDTRVAALEKQIASLQSTINDQAIQGNLSDSENGITVNQPTQHERNGSESPVPDSGHAEVVAEQNTRVSEPEETITSLIGSDLLPIDKAIALFTEFIKNVLPEYPILLLTDEDDFNTLRTSQATLLLAMITAGARASDPVLFRNLHSHLLRVLADKVLVRGLRSLELAQAILVMEVWYDPPDDMERLNFYMWIQIAATMVRQLGLWPHGKGSLRLRTPEPSEQDGRRMDELRVAFAVNLSMSTVAVSLRRPISTRWTEKMRETLERFHERSVHINDKRLVAWIKLQIIGEDIEFSRIRVASSENNTGISAAFNLSHLQTLEGKLSEWRNTAEPVTNGVYTTSPDHARDMAYIRIVMSLIQSCHGVLDAHLHLTTSTYLRAPTVTTVRALYAMQVIYSLWKLVHYEQTNLSKFINEEVLGFRFYARQTKDFFERAMGAEGFQVPRMALDALAHVMNDKLVLSSEGHSLPRPPHPRESAKDLPCKPTNDLESILIVDVVQSKGSAHLSRPGHDPEILSFNQATDRVYYQPSFTQHYSFVGEDCNAMGLSDFEMMAMPSIADPNFFSAEDEINTGQHMSWGHA